MIRVGITGQEGFIGNHLYNYLGILENIIRVQFKDSYFENENQLKNFVSSCDVIVHLAAMNRHKDQMVIYKTNIQLVKQLIKACEDTHSLPHILFSSSTQEEQDNLYGKSKKEGRELFEKWAQANNASFSGIVIPNVFGPFGKPYYNSFIATFCYQLTHNEQPKINVDGEVKLIFVDELVKKIIHIFSNKETGVSRNEIPYTKSIKVSETLAYLNNFKHDYLENGIFPDLSDRFVRNLFNTFVCYIDHENYFPRSLTKHKDQRGFFVETSKEHGGQNSFSTTVPNITRGNHFHTRKAERFTVIKGKAKLELRRIGADEVLEFIIDADNSPAYVDMPIWYTHNIMNIGDSDLYTVFWISEHYNPDDSDTFFENVRISNLE